MGIRQVSIVAVLVWGLAGWAVAQEAVQAGEVPEPPAFQVPAGARVRLASDALPGAAVVGRVSRWTDDILALAVSEPDAPLGGVPLAVPQASVRRLEVSLGRRSYWKQGALSGAILGAAGGAAAQVDTSESCSLDSDAYCSRGEAVAFSAVTGALLGGLVGALVKTERWQKVSVEVLAPRSSASRGAPRGTRPSVAARVAVRF
jgi:hypothetical protein